MIEIAPNETIASLNGSNVTVQCTAYNCSLQTSIIVHKNGKENGHCTPFEGSVNVNTSCSSIVSMGDNGSSIYCYNQWDGSQSAEIELLVQG